MAESAERHDDDTVAFGAGASSENSDIAWNRDEQREPVGSEIAVVRERVGHIDEYKTGILLGCKPRCILAPGVADA